jgi:hypothetical protein
MMHNVCFGLYKNYNTRWYCLVDTINYEIKHNNNKELNTQFLELPLYLKRISTSHPHSTVLKLSQCREIILCSTCPCCIPTTVLYNCCKWFSHYVANKCISDKNIENWSIFHNVSTDRVMFCTPFWEGYNSLKCVYAKSRTA